MSIDKVKKLFQIKENTVSEVFDLSEKVDAIEEEIKNSFKGEKGDKGDKGDRGENGKDGKNGKEGKTPTKEELKSIIKPLIPKQQEIDTNIIAYDASKMALDEFKSNIDNFIPKIDLEPLKNDLNSLKEIVNEIDGEDIVNKINSLPIKPEFQIDAKHIKNLPSQVQYVGRGNGGLETYEVVSIVNNTIKFADDETPTGDIDGVNTDFVLANTPKDGSVKVYVNGSRMRITEDYTISDKTISFLIPPPSGSIILTDYRYV